VSCSSEFPSLQYIFKNGFLQNNHDCNILVAKKRTLNVQAPMTIEASSPKSQNSFLTGLHGRSTTGPPAVVAFFITCGVTTPMVFLLTGTISYPVILSQLFLVLKIFSKNLNFLRDYSELKSVSRQRRGQKGLDTGFFKFTSQLTAYSRGKRDSVKHKPDSVKR
jgi:hypothetical protein